MSSTLHVYEHNAWKKSFIRLHSVHRQQGCQEQQPGFSRSDSTYFAMLNFSSEDLFNDLCLISLVNKQTVLLVFPFCK